MKPQRFAVTRLALALLPLLHAGHALTATVTWAAAGLLGLGCWTRRRAAAAHRADRCNA